MRTYRRPDLPRYTSWREDRTRRGEFDQITGVLLGAWSSEAAARAHVQGKRLSYGLGFFADDDSLIAQRGPGGLIELEFTARGLFASKFKDQDGGSTLDVRSLESVSHPWAPAIPNPAPRLEFTHIRPTLEVTVCAPAGRILADWPNQGKPIDGSSHWTLAGCGRTAFPSVGVSPYTSGEFTYHYPYGWFFVIQPLDSLGSGGDRLLSVRYFWAHQWPKTIGG